MAAISAAPGNATLCAGSPCTGTARGAIALAAPAWPVNGCCTAIGGATLTPTSPPGGAAASLAGTGPMFSFSSPNSFHSSISSRSCCGARLARFHGNSTRRRADPRLEHRWGESDGMAGK
nr:hypothetical protein CFP56_22200 [Quercus suber]